MFAALYIGIGMAVAALALHRIRWAFLLVLFLYTTYPRLLAVGVSGEGFALSMQFVTLTALALVWGLLLVLGDARVREGLRLLRQHKLLAVALVGVFATKTLATFLQGGLPISSISALVNDYLITLNVVLLALLAVQTRRDVVAVCLIVTASVLVNQAWAFAGMIKGSPLLDGLVEVSFRTEDDFDPSGRTRTGLYRVMGTFTNPLQLSTFLCLSVPLVAFAFRWGRQRRWIAGVALVALLPVLFRTLSRSGLLNLGSVVGAAVLQRVFRQGRFARSLRIVVIAVVLIAAVGSLQLLLNTVNRAILDRDLDVTQDASTVERLAQYVIVGQLITASPRVLVLGYGAQRNLATSLDDLFTLDNYYLRTLLEGGIVGLSFLLLQQLALYRLALRIESASQSAWTRSWALTVKLHLVSLFVAMMFFSVPYFYLYYYLVAGMSVGIYARMERAAPERPAKAMLVAS
ncbi:MAG: O-antigen ligase family protein [Bacteroidota bacterium]